MQFQFDREYQIQVNQKKVSVIEWGEPDATPVLCLHGWLDNAATFHYLAPLLKNQYRLIAIELPGHGQSEHLSADADYQFVSAITVIDAVLDILHIDSCKVIGHSMGGALALLYAGVVKQRIEKLALIDSFGAFTMQPEKTFQQLQAAIDDRKKVSGNKRYFSNLEIAAKARSQVSELSWRILYPLIERGVMLTNKGYQWSSDSRLKQASWLRMSEAQHDSVLQQVVAEVLLLEAEQGILDKFPIQHRLSLVKNVRHKIKKGGHHFHMQYPEDTANEILSFFE